MFLFVFPNSLVSKKKIQNIGEEQFNPSIVVVGFILAENPFSSIAVLKFRNKNRMRALKIGEEAFGMKLIRMFSDRIVLEKGEKSFEIFFGNNKFKKLSESKEASLEKVAASDEREILDSEISKDFHKTIQLERQVLERIARAEMPRLVNQVKILQNVIDGKMRGAKIDQLPSEKFISELEIYENDIILEVNGIEIKNFQTLFSLYSKLRNKNRFEVVIGRSGKLVRMLYILK